MNQDIKRHLISAAHTFVAAFVLAIGPLVASADLSQGVTKAIAVSIVLAGARAGVKAMFEYLAKPRA